MPRRPRCGVGCGNGRAAVGSVDRGCGGHRDVFLRIGAVPGGGRSRWHRRRHRRVCRPRGALAAGQRIRRHVRLLPGRERLGAGPQRHDGRVNVQPAGVGVATGRARRSRARFVRRLHQRRAPLLPQLHARFAHVRRPQGAGAVRPGHPRGHVRHAHVRAPPRQQQPVPVGHGDDARGCVPQAAHHVRAPGGHGDAAGQRGRRRALHRLQPQRQAARVGQLTRRAGGVGHGAPPADQNVDGAQAVGHHMRKIQP
mmetsp:Transcript_16340/g.48679  ORF Transcript_16340/g.48679 Transcript_16340/m.48679 type:complete len:254 (-) Transcript_16340:3176-3937(-)